MDAFRQIAHELTAADYRESDKRGHNIYALAIELEALHEIEAEVAAGADLAQAFADAFNPTRKNHRIARKVGLSLNVDRGQWVHERS